jgi:hypothetical protein
LAQKLNWFFNDMKTYFNNTLNTGKTAFSFCILFLLHAVVNAQDTLQARIILIGDAGQLTNGKHPVVSSVKKTIPFNEKTTIIYLGDNLYRTGLPDNSIPTYEMAKAPLDTQINIAGKSKAKVYFVPGNHDWAVGSSNGYESILREQAYIDFLGNENVKMYPRDGCPGPVEAKITDDVTLVMMDTQWWLHLGDKPGIESDCLAKTKDEVLIQLEDILTKNAGKLVLIAFHHTFRTYSPHGGYFTWRQHIFPFTDMRDYLYIPLPLVGSIYPLTRAVFGVEQDLKSPPYQEMITAIDNVVRGHQNVIYAAGHDHSIQIIQDSGYNYITSGSAAKNSRVSKGKNSLYASPKAGYVTLEISKKKKVQANVYIVEGDSTVKEYSNHILDFSTVPAAAVEKKEVAYKFRDSVVVAASEKYKPKTGFQKFFVGSNYQQEWSTPIAMRDFNISKEKGGFTIKGLGGGKHSKTLQLADKNGKEWILRSVDKDIEKVVPLQLRNSLAPKMSQDLISTSHPHAPLVIPGLARAVGVPASTPEFFYVPDDPALGLYRKTFANTVALLEFRDPGTGVVDAKSTGKIINSMLEDNEHHVDQEKVLTARLLDMLIGDWDRHADQWRWGTSDTGVGKLYFPIPKERDQAFSNSDGFLVNRAAKKLVPFLQGFRSEIEDINGFNYQTKDFDRFFINNLDEKAWQRITKDFQRRMTDSVIENAVKKFPEPIYKLDAQMVMDKLKSRREALYNEALTYYKFISKVVTVAGSNKSEFFHVKKHPEGLQVTVYKKLNTTDSASVMFTRVFQETVTKEIRLFGLNGNDKFEIDKDVSSGILLRIIGGKGNDTFDLKGNIRNKVYDLSLEKNASINLVKSKTDFSTNPRIHDYSMTGFSYNQLKFPQLELGYNTEDLFLIGGGITLRTHGFRKDPYATEQRLGALYAPGRDAFRIKYTGNFTKAVFKNDLLVRADLVYPTNNNFFGFGNKTVFDKNLPVDYYRVRYKYLETDILLKKKMGSMIEVSIGPTYYRYWSDPQDNDKRIMNNPLIIGADSATTYSTKNYLGAKARFDINYVNNDLFPTRGMIWYTELNPLYGIGGNAKNIVRFTTDATIYASLTDNATMGAIFRLGAGHIFGKNYEYFQALSLGAHNVLRGYRKNRFSGSSLMYASTELRVRIIKSQSYVLPGDFGVMGFYDLGRVWHKGEDSRKWHGAYGAGLYFMPYGLTMMSFTVGFSPEDRLLNFTLGTKFKLVY